MSATRCTCIWGTQPLALLVKDPECGATHVRVTASDRARQLHGWN